LTSTPQPLAQALEVAVAREVLRDLTKHPRHTFWADGISVLDRAVPAIVGASQLTDAYLLGLAVRRRGWRRWTRESLAGRARLPIGSRRFSSARPARRSGRDAACRRVAGAGASRRAARRHAGGGEESVAGAHAPAATA
jgi:hypothetical protein